VSYEEWVDVSKDVYKTQSIVLRELPDGSYAGAYEITQSQYELVTGSTPSSFGPDPARPVETVSWNDITDSGNYNAGFIKSLRDKTGLTSLDLPDEAAWDFAARAGATNGFNDYTLNRGKGENWDGALSDPTLENLGWYIDNSASMTHSVGGKQGNAWGLFDMHGNVLEWTTTVEPEGPRLITRSSYWNYGAESCTVDSATPRFSSTRFYGIGFRLALPANP
jgi:formylglycine-generating enzyme required for sulfatase activity